MFGSAFIGFAFGILAIQERSLDRWIVAFVKALLTHSNTL